MSGFKKKSKALACLIILAGCNKVDYAKLVCSDYTDNSPEYNQCIRDELNSSTQTSYSYQNLQANPAWCMGMAGIAGRSSAHCPYTTAIAAGQPGAVQAYQNYQQQEQLKQQQLMLQDLHDNLNGNAWVDHCRPDGRGGMRCSDY